MYKYFKPTSPQDVVVALIGHRNMHERDYDKFDAIVTNTLTRHNYRAILVVSGGCRGTDTLAERYAAKHEIELEVFKPDVEKHGSFTKAAVIRNRQIATRCNVMIAFPDVLSGKGTQMTMKMARAKGKRVFQCRIRL